MRRTALLLTTLAAAAVPAVADASGEELQPREWKLTGSYTYESTMRTVCPIKPGPGTITKTVITRRRVSYDGDGTPSRPKRGRKRPAQKGKGSLGVTWEETIRIVEDAEGNDYVRDTDATTPPKHNANAVAFGPHVLLSKDGKEVSAWAERGGAGESGVRVPTPRRGQSVDLDLDRRFERKPPEVSPECTLATDEISVVGSLKLTRAKKWAIKD